jgi:pyruvate dehydrogenase (quinone)
LLDVYTNRYELVMPPTVTVQNVTGMATYMAKAVLGGRFKEAESLMKNAVKMILS